LKKELKGNEDCGFNIRSDTIKNSRVKGDAELTIGLSYAEEVATRRKSNTNFTSMGK
jgi:hypothetical protein